jgi:hypothetical protein
MLDLQLPPFMIIVAWAVLLWWRSGKGDLKRKRGWWRILTVLWTGVAAVGCTALIEVAMRAGVLQLGGD